ncbi:DNA-3-methyladenine glycosylase I [Rhizobium sp. TH2]|uniref:DNA-3-methyladenine glycosylase I n=1 Tax=Rhizobium sp. TH2 TaxID=2775403 RepID=UPI002157CDEB|nr:DNA-3-methyladenine glycosylase I [Rhizobium sp. TH2]UVC10203.1 DNA-3-methyladenine glycosylase I [Rhizobium sp. TH2]
MALKAFGEIRERAEARKGKAAIEERLKNYMGRFGDDVGGDDRLLAEMAKYIFSSGISWKVVESKWPGIEDAFLGFDPNLLNIQPDDFWHDLLGDKRIIRHGAKVQAIRRNAAFVSDLAREHGSALKFLLDWPSNDLVGLFEFLKKHGDRLGGQTGQYVLRAIGKENFVISRDVVACLKDAGVAITGDGAGKAERKAIQAAFNQWAEETGLPMSHLSVIAAQSIDSH